MTEKRKSNKWTDVSVQREVFALISNTYSVTEDEITLEKSLHAEDIPVYDWLYAAARGTSSAIYNDFDGDVLDNIEFVLALENNFNIEISDDEFFDRADKSVAAVIELVKTKLNQ